MNYHNMPVKKIIKKLMEKFCGVKNTSYICGVIVMYITTSPQY